VGCNAGLFQQLYNSIAVGTNAGNCNQASYSIALGFESGFCNQTQYSLAIGPQAGQCNQGYNVYGGTTGYTIAQGYQAGFSSQQVLGIALGSNAGYGNQGSNTVAIGNGAGYLNQSTNSIAIGNKAGFTNQPGNTIILNASGIAVNGARTNAFYVSPIFNDTTTSGLCNLQYNPDTNEITYAAGTSVQLVSSVIGLGSSRYISTLSLTSTVKGLGSLGYVSSLSLTSTVEGIVKGSTSNVTIVSSVQGNFSSLAVNCNFASYTLDVNGTINASGDVIAYSDRRVKENIIPVTNALGKINQLQAVYYTRKDLEDKKRNIGFIAQEVEEVVPEVVMTDSSEEKKKSLAYQNLTALLAQGIKEEYAEISTFKATFQTLASEHSTLKSMFVQENSTLQGKFLTLSTEHSTLQWAFIHRS
jgi:hypothetical protein